MTVVRNSQTVVEVLSQPTAKVRTSQVVVETLSLPNARVRAGQVVVEVLRSTTAGAVAAVPWPVLMRSMRSR